MPKGHGRPYNAKERAASERAKGPLGFLFPGASAESKKKTDARVSGWRAAEQNITRKVRHDMGFSSTDSSGARGSPDEAFASGKRPKVY